MKLTDREREVVEAMIVHGNMKMIGRVLGVSEQSIKEHMFRIRRKTGLKHNICVCVNYALAKREAVSA